MKKATGKIEFIVFIVLALFYCTFSITVLWDSAHYMSFVSIFEGTLPWNSWDIVRGPVFPLIIHLSNIIFGKTSQGLIILTFIFYIITILLVFKILKPIILKEQNRVKKIILIVLSLFLIIINPIVFGYYHTLLTEFVAMTLAVIMSYISWKLIGIKFTKINFNYIKWVLLYCVATTFSYFLKQPYVTVTLFPLLISIIICLFDKEKFKFKIYKIIIFFISCLCLILSMKCWNSFLEKKEVQTNSDRNAVSNLSGMLITAITNFEIDNNEYNKKDITNNSMFDSKEKKKLLSSYELYNIYNVIYRNKVIDKIVIPKDNISIGQSIIIIANTFFKSPMAVIEAYYSNYLAIANIYPKTTSNGVGYKVVKKYSLNYCHENCVIAERISINNSNIFYMTDEMYSRVSLYEQENNAPRIFRGILRITNPIHNIIYSLSILLLPIILLLSIILRIKTKYKFCRDRMNLCIIFLGFSFLHILAHAIMGAAIDRYASPAIIPMYISYILMLSLIKNNGIKKEN